VANPADANLPAFEDALSAQPGGQVKASSASEKADAAGRSLRIEREHREQKPANPPRFAGVQGPIIKLLGLPPWQKHHPG
jgi:hypothetical protein